MGKMKEKLILETEKYLEEHNIPNTPENWNYYSALLSTKIKPTRDEMDEMLANLDDSYPNEESYYDE